MIGLLGAGSQAREIASYVGADTALFWAVSAEYLPGHDDPDWIDITAPPAERVEAPVVGAVGTPGLRRDLVALWPGDRYATVVAPSAYVDDSSLLGQGTVMAPGSVITVDVTTSDHCLINVGATVSHDSRLGAYVTLSPGAHVAGNVHIGDGAFLGIGSVVSHGVSIASGVVVAAGAVVMADVTEPNTVVAGVPARPIDVRADWFRVL